MKYPNIKCKVKKLLTLIQIICIWTLPTPRLQDENIPTYCYFNTFLKNCNSKLHSFRSCLIEQNIQICA